MNSDYDAAKVPMLPVTHGTRSTRNHILVYTLLLALTAAALLATPISGWTYLVAVIVMNGLFIKGAIQLWRRDDADAKADDFKVERSVFKLSLVYLFAHFTALMVDAMLAGFGIGGPF
jgi:protoheme IX farnesyltransferase